MLKRSLWVVRGVMLCAALAFGVMVANARGAANQPEGHAWVVVPESRPGAQAMLLHLPPRQSGADDGVAAVAMGLERVPVRVATWDERVYLAFGRERPGEGSGTGEWQWRVQRVQAERFGRTWMYPPGRPEALSPLRLRWVDELKEPFLAGFGGSRDGPVALLAVRERGVDENAPRSVRWDIAELRLNAGRDWQIAPLPWQRISDDAPAAPAPLARLTLAGLETGAAVGVFEPGSSKLVVWIGTAGSMESGQFGPPVMLEWAAHPFVLPEGLGVPRWISGVPGRSALVGGLAAAWVGDAGVRVGMLEGGRVRLLDTTKSGADAGMGLMPGGSLAGPRAVVAWMDASNADASAVDRPDRPTRRLMLSEVSLDTGRTLYAGPAKIGLTLVTRQYQVVAGVLIAVAIVTMLFVLRPDRPALALPKGAVTAGGLRRMLAAGIDVLFGAGVAAALLGVSAWDLLDPRSYLAGELGLGAWGTLIGLTALHCSIGESIAGQSIGKLITGCTVVNVRGTPGAATLVQAVIRNLIRWALPPLGILVLMDRDGRHPGDLAAGTAVVVPEDVPDEE